MGFLTLHRNIYDHMLVIFKPIYCQRKKLQQDKPSASQQYLMIKANEIVNITKRLISILKPWL